MDEDNMIFVDDTRNAIPQTNWPTMRQPTVVRRPAVVVQGTGVRPVVPASAVPASVSMSTYPAVYAQPAPTVYAQAPSFFPAASPFAPYGAPNFGASQFGSSSAYGPWGPFGPVGQMNSYGYPYGQQSVLSRLGDISPATIVDVASRLLAALSPLPEPPSAIGKDSDISVEDAVSYQEALAKHAKKDEQLRELGFALAALLRGDLRRSGQ